MQNSPEEQNPCPTIMTKALKAPQDDMVMAPPATNDIWATEDRAIRCFISVWITHRALIIAPPTSDQTITSSVIIPRDVITMGTIRIKPYPPNFKRIPARIIDPATGASTWAFGSQRWTI